MIPNSLYILATYSTYAQKCKPGTLFGLIPWYKYLPYSDFKDCGNIQTFNFLPTSGVSGSDIPLILLAIVDDLLRVAGIVAVGFVIYGAIQFVVSQGQPEKTA